MDLFNLLCVESDRSSYNLLLLVGYILAIITCLALISGIVKVCNNFRNRKMDEKAKKNFKIGLYLLIFSIILLLFFVVILVIDSNSSNDGCIGPIASVVTACFRIIHLVPLVFIAKSIIEPINWLYYGKKGKDRLTKKELIHKIITYIVIAVLIFLIFLLFNVAIGLYTTSWTQCWCG